jgi:pimeloyl-ACP methyl ester carboxylesterase
LIGHLRGSADTATALGYEALAPDLLGYGAQRDVAESDITLPAQVAELRAAIRHAYASAPVDVVGHSVGGVIALLLAAQWPDTVRRVVSVEGNFTLKDAFWSASLGRMSIAEVSAVLGDFERDPGAWLSRSGVLAAGANLATARDWLAFQPATTLRAMGRSIVAVTAVPGYLATVRKVFSSRSVCLLAGERSRAGWDVPPWASELAAAEQAIAGAGHLLMLDQPDAFMRTVLGMLS